MPAAKEVEKKAPEEVPSKPAAELVTDEMKEAAEASAKARNVARAEEEATKGLGVLRRQGGKGAGSKLEVSDVPYPAAIHGDDFENYGPMGFGAHIPPGTEIAAYAVEQEFMIDPEKVKYLTFDRPGRNLPKKRLYNIKALHKDGRLVQLGAEAQIQNNAGGDPLDAIGLRRYERKGITLLLDWQTLVPIYCGAWDCWAQAMGEGPYAPFCSERHAKHTLPNTYKGASAIHQGLMEQGVTTTAVWSA